MTSGIYERTKETKLKISETRKKLFSEGKLVRGGIANFKGDKVGKRTFHYWVRKNKPKPQFCENCNLKMPFDLANVNNHEYTRNSKDYKWLCRSCHSDLDFPDGLIGKNFNGGLKQNA